MIGQSAAVTGTWWWWWSEALEEGGGSPLESSVAGVGNQGMSATACAKVASQCDVAPGGETCAHTHTHENIEIREEEGGRGGPPTSLIVQRVKEESSVLGYSDKQQLVQQSHQEQSKIGGRTHTHTHI